MILSNGDTYWVLDKLRLLYYNKHDAPANFGKQLVQKQIFTKYVPLWLYMPILNGILTDIFYAECFGYSDFKMYWIGWLGTFSVNMYELSDKKSDGI